MTELKRVVVHRPNWLRGDMNASTLCNLQGEKCCLGFAGKQVLGMSDADLLPHRTPLSIFWDKIDPTYQSTRDASDTDRLMVVNDQMMNGARREARIIELGKRIGLEFVFTDEPEIKA